MICRLFVARCYLFRECFLCFHQLAASFCKIPGGVGYLSGTSAPSASLHPACPELRGEPRRARYPLSLLLLPRGTTPGGERADPFSRRSRCALSTFRINTCKSVSKQTTLTPFRINSYEKPRGRGGTSFQRFFSPLVYPDLRGATRTSSLPQSHAPRGASILYHLSRLRTLPVATGVALLFRASNPHWPRYNPSLHAISEYPERHRSLGTRAASPSATRPAPTRPPPRHSPTPDLHCLEQLPHGI